MRSRVGVLLHDNTLVSTAKWQNVIQTQMYSTCGPNIPKQLWGVFWQTCSALCKVWSGDAQHKFRPPFVYLGFMPWLICGPDVANRIGPVIIPRGIGARCGPNLGQSSFATWEGQFLISGSNLNCEWQLWQNLIQGITWNSRIHLPSFSKDWKSSKHK